VASYSGQGQTCDRVLINIDTDQARGKLLHSRLAYVAVSRAEFDAHIYTNDADSLAMHLSRDVSQRSAIEDQSVKQLDIEKDMNEEPMVGGQPSRLQDQIFEQVSVISLEIG
jgi:ATP-dependent exoDNAse (exonuclease V) alpha subunit